MNIESLIQLLLKNKRLMTMAVKKITNIVVEKMEGASIVKITTVEGERKVFATNGKIFWEINSNDFFDLGDAVGFGIKLNLEKILISKASQMKGISVFLENSNGEIYIRLEDLDGRIFGEGTISEMIEKGISGSSKEDVSEIASILS